MTLPDDGLSTNPFEYSTGGVPTVTVEGVIPCAVKVAKKELDTLLYCNLAASYVTEKDAPAVWMPVSMLIFTKTPVAPDATDAGASTVKVSAELLVPQNNANSATNDSFLKEFI
jgi:hypothetical protein